MSEDSSVEKSLADSESLFFRTLGDVRGYKIPLIQIKPQDRYRLLILKAWATYHKLPYREVIRVLVSFWDDRMAKLRGRTTLKTKSLIGTRIATLTGAVSEQVLDDYVAERFPNEEQVVVWKQNRRDKLVAHSLDTEPLPSSSPDVMLEEYEARIDSVRQLAQVADKPGSKFKRRRWRDNPWY